MFFHNIKGKSCSTSHIVNRDDLILFMAHRCSKDFKNYYNNKKELETASHIFGTGDIVFIFSNIPRGEYAQ